MSNRVEATTDVARRPRALAWAIGAIILSTSLAALIIAAAASNANVVVIASVVAILTTLGGVGFWLGLSRTLSKDAH